MYMKSPKPHPPNLSANGPQILQTRPISVLGFYTVQSYKGMMLSSLRVHRYVLGLIAGNESPNKSTATNRFIKYILAARYSLFQKKHEYMSVSTIMVAKPPKASPPPSKLQSLA